MKPLIVGAILCSPSLRNRTSERVSPRGGYTFLNHGICPATNPVQSDAPADHHLHLAAVRDEPKGAVEGDQRDLDLTRDQTERTGWKDVKEAIGTQLV